jgi:hypothetical protein
LPGHLSPRQTAPVGQSAHLNRVNVQVGRQALDIEIVVSHGACFFVDSNRTDPKWGQGKLFNLPLSRNRRQQPTPAKETAPAQAIVLPATRRRQT